MKKSKKAYKFGTAEKKLLVQFAYYFALEVVGFIVFSIAQRNAAPLQKELLNYFTCEASGHDPANPCDRRGFESYTSAVPSMLSYMLLLLAPMVNFLFVIDFQVLRNRLRGVKESTSVSTNDVI